MERLVHDLEAWREAAACALSPAVDFFPPPDDRRAITRAKAVCAACPVAADCLAFAIDTRQDDGVWGGTTRAERRRVRRQWTRQVREAS